MAKERHWGITVLGVLGYIGAVLTLLAGLAMLFGSAIVSQLINEYRLSGNLEKTFIIPESPTLFIILGIILIGLAILDYFIAKGLLDGKNWARIITIVFSALSVLSSLYPFSKVNLAIGAAIIWYLGFYKPAVNYFK